MATSGSASTSVTNGKRVMRMTWQLVSQDPDTNVSEVKVVVTWSVAATYGLSSGTNNTVTVNCLGTPSTSVAAPSIASGATKTIFSKTLIVYHDSDGSKSGTITVSWPVNVTLNSGTRIGTLNISTNVTLPSMIVDRKSVPTASATSVNIGGTITINMNPFKDTYTHSISYKFNGASSSITTGLSATSGIKNSCTFTPPASLVSSMGSSSTSANAVFTITTYKSDGTSLGSNTITITVNAVASNYPPTMDSVTASVYANETPFTNVYVKNYNGVKLSFSATAKNGASISSYKISGGGITATTTSTSYTIDKLTVSGNTTFTVTATDSRGATCSKTVTISVVTYNPPAITDVRSVRCDKDGNPSDEGTYIKVNASASYSNIGNNTSGSIIIKVQYAAEGGSYNSGNNLTVTKNSGKATGSAVIGGSLGDGAYKVLYTVTDAYNKTNTYVDILSTSFYVLDFNSGGTSMGIGAAASDTEHILTIGMDQISFPNGSVSTNVSNLTFTQKTTTINFSDELSTTDDLIIKFNDNNKQLKLRSNGNLVLSNGVMLKWEATSGETPYFITFNNGNQFVLGDDNYTTILRGSTVRLNSVSGEVITSDERAKKDFKTLEDYEEFFLDLNPIAYKYLTGTSDRYHIGFKAQDVKKSLEDNNLTTQDFGGYIEMPTDKDFYIDTIGYDPIKSDTECGLTYNEFIGLAVHMIQKQHDEIQELKDRIAALERSDK